jgi:hypothetical protein
VHCLTESTPDEAKITASVHAMIREVQKYVPGYRLKNGPVFDGNRVSIWLEVEGLGDYLPKYAGNLDIMTAAALRTGEMIAEEIAAGRFIPQPTAAWAREDNLKGRRSSCACACATACTQRTASLDSGSWWRARRAGVPLIEIAR